MKKGIVSGEGIEITKRDKRIVVSPGGIEIRREGRLVSGEVVRMGFVYLVVDCSGSMAGGNKLSQAKKGALNFAEDTLTKGYLTGLIQFGSSATHLCEPQRGVSVLHHHLEMMSAEGGTNMVDAIELATTRLKDKKGFRVMVIVTDGMPTAGEPDPQTATLLVAQRAKKKDIDIITIGTDDADRGFLRKLASRTELTVMVSRDHLGRGITSAAKMLPGKSEPRQGR